MHGTQSIDFSIEKPVSGSYLKLKQMFGCDYRLDMSAWEIRHPRGYLEFTINADDKGGTGFVEVVLRCCDGIVNGLTNCPITVSVNEKSISEYNKRQQGGAFKDPDKLNWYDKSFYIPPGLIKPGENTVRVQAEGGSTVFFLQKVTLSCSMHGTESIDFSVENPVSGSYLKLKQMFGCDYRSDMSAWEIRDPHGFLEFTINIGDKTGDKRSVGIVLRACSGLVNGLTDCPITVSVNQDILGKDIFSKEFDPIRIKEFDPHQVQWYDKYVYIPPNLLIDGDNTILVQADGGSTVFFLQKVTLSCFKGQYQQQDNWCWAACTASIATYYNLSNTWTQGSLVNTAFEQTTCIDKGSTPQCNKPWLLDKALELTTNLAKSNRSKLTVDQIEEQITGTQPIFAGIAWEGGGGHAVVIVGVGKKEKVLAIEDPWYGSSVTDYDLFCTGYQSSGTWKQYCLTKK